MCFLSLSQYIYIYIYTHTHTHIKGHSINKGIWEEKEKSFLEFFSINVNSTLLGSGYHKNICFEAIQNSGKLNRGLSSNFWWLKNANPMKFTEEYVMCMEKYILIKKVVYKWAKHWFAPTSPSQKDTVHRMEIHRFFDK